MRVSVFRISISSVPGSSSEAIDCLFRITFNNASFIDRSQRRGIEAASKETGPRGQARRFITAALLGRGLAIRPNQEIGRATVLNCFDSGLQQTLIALRQISIHSLITNFTRSVSAVLRSVP